MIIGVGNSQCTWIYISWGPEAFGDIQTLRAAHVAFKVLHWVFPIGSKRAGSKNSPTCYSVETSYSKPDGIEGKSESGGNGPKPFLHNLGPDGYVYSWR